MMWKYLPLLLLCILLPFQACNKNINFSSKISEAFKSEANGEGYGGKPTPYDFADLKNPCSVIGANGNPLPNRQIFMFPNGAVQLVREECSDIAPRTLHANEYTLGTNGEIIYQNQIFIPNFSQGPFDVVAAKCPAGQNLLTNSVRKSLVQDSLDLQSSNWERAGLSIALEGSLASLPLYRVKRNDPNALESWHRLAQSPLLRGTESYVFSFYVKPDASEKMMFTSYFPNVQDFRVEFDLITGAATLHSAVGVTDFSTAVQPFSNGLFISIYFKPDSDVQANIGVASSGQFLGSAVSMTALQLERISNFCSP